MNTAARKTRLEDNVSKTTMNESVIPRSLRNLPYGRQVIPRQRSWLILFASIASTLPIHANSPSVAAQELGIILPTSQGRSSVGDQFMVQMQYHRTFLFTQASMARSSLPAPGNLSETRIFLSGIAEVLKTDEAAVPEKLLFSLKAIEVIDAADEWDHLKSGELQSEVLVFHKDEKVDLRPTANNAVDRDLLDVLNRFKEGMHPLFGRIHPSYIDGKGIAARQWNVVDSSSLRKSLSLFCGVPVQQDMFSSNCELLLRDSSNNFFLMDDQPRDFPLHEIACNTFASQESNKDAAAQVGIPFSLSIREKFRQVFPTRPRLAPSSLRRLRMAAVASNGGAVRPDVDVVYQQFEKLDVLVLPKRTATNSDRNNEMESGMREK